MSKQTNTCGFKLAAIDIDGTLLGPDHHISRENRRAVAQLQEHGVEVVLASGRHFRSMEKLAKELGGVQWLVSAQGGEVSQVGRGLVLSQMFLPPEEVCRVLHVGQGLGFSCVVYAEDAVCRLDDGEAVKLYSGIGAHPLPLVSVEQCKTMRIFKVIWAGAETRIDTVAASAEVGALAACKVRTHQNLLEFVPDGVTKGSGMTVLAAHLQIEATQALAFGDAENDIPLFAWAGVSVAMPHGWPLALARATLTGPQGPPESALARAIEYILSPRTA